MNSLTQFKIFKEIPILPLLIPRIHNLLLPYHPRKFPHAQASPRKSQFR